MRNLSSIILPLPFFLHLNLFLVGEILFLNPFIRLTFGNQEAMDKWFEEHKDSLMNVSEFFQMMESGKTIDELEESSELTIVEDFAPFLKNKSTDGVFSLFLNSSYNQIEGRINSKEILRYVKEESGEEVNVCRSGLIFTRLDGLSRLKPPPSQLFCTSQAGGFRTLDITFDNLQPQNHIIITSLGNGSVFLNDSSRERFSEVGSQWARNYTFGDNWSLSFVKGGKVPIEVLIPKTFPFDGDRASNLFLHLPLTEAGCPTWPDTDLWNARREFCETNFGFGQLCSCKHPLVFLSSNKRSKKSQNEDQIPISIPTTFGRIRHIYRVLECLAKSKDVSREQILISLDGYDQDIVQLASILNIKYLIHEGEERAHTSSRTNQNIRVVLLHHLRQFPKAKFFILLEDDLFLSSDFYQFMVKVSPIFAMDETIWCVSGYNSFSQNGRDPTKLYRGVNFPRWGWMMPRGVLEEILPKWPKKELGYEWDNYLSSEKINKNRVCLVPEKLRSMHGPTSGNNVRMTSFNEKYLNRRSLNKEGSDNLEPLNRLVKENYEREMLSRLKRATPLQIASPFSHLKALKRREYVIYLNKNSEDLEITSAIVHKIFGVWDHFVLHTVLLTVLHIDLRTIYVVQHPSVYSVFLPKGYAFYEPSDDDIDKYFSE